MFVILSYDINQKRGKKALKICRKYLKHVHNSVFEGEITEAKLNKLEKELTPIIKTNSDTIRVYRLPAPKFLDVDVIGRCPDNPTII